MLAALPAALLLAIASPPARAEGPAAPAAPAAPATPARLLAPVPPAYPDAALADQLVGDVAIRVTIDPTGRVVTATYVDGPEVFAQAAITAALALQFEPATADGVPVSAELVATFHFEPPPDDAAEDVERIVVEGHTHGSGDPHAVVTLGEQALTRSSGSDLGETVAQVPGVTVARGTADATKPIIRGQYERRLLVLFDDVRHESQKWGLDHATEIDPFAAGRIDVIKGAAGVRYGPDAIGGVVLVEPPPLRLDVGVGGRVQLTGVSNGRRAVAAARLDGVFARLPSWSWRVEGDYGQGAAVRAPDYVLGNTASRSWNVGGTAAWSRDRTQVRLTARRYAFEGGVCYCVRANTPDELRDTLAAPAPVGSDAWTTTYAVDRPFQSVAHTLALAHVTHQTGFGSVTAVYAFQHNLRREYDQVRETIEGPQYDFTLRTHSLDVAVAADEREVGRTALDASAGVSSTFQENVYRGLPLIPNFRTLQGGLYALARATRGTVVVEAGARADHQARAAFLTPSAFERAVARGTLDEDDCELGEDAARCPLTFDAGSVTLGSIWRPAAEKVEVRLDLSSASRFPNADELYMGGSAPTWPVYAVGDPDLHVETTWGASPTVGVHTRWIDGEASAFANAIDNYVYFAPALNDAGEPAIDVTIDGAFPRYSFRPVDATFYGADGGVTIGPDAPVRLRAAGSYVRGVDRSTGVGLVGVPANRALGAVQFAPRVRGVDEPVIELSVEHVARQTFVDPTQDFADPPPAYTLLDASANADVTVQDRVVHVGVSASNLLNTRYRSYTSLLRYYADEPGRELRARIGVDF